MEDKFAIRKGSIGFMTPAVSVTDEKTYVIDRVIGFLHEEDWTGSPVVRLGEIACYLDISVNTIVKKLRENMFLFSYCWKTKIPVDDLRTYLFSCYHQIGKSLFRGKIDFPTDEIFISVNSFADSRSVIESIPIFDVDKFMNYRMLTVAETSDVLGISTKVVYRLIRSGEMPYFKIGNTYRFSADCLAIYLGITSSAKTGISLIKSEFGI